MGSAHVLPNLAISARKQEHLEAGKRRLEEFRSLRKQKAASGVKKAVSAAQAPRLCLLDSEGAATSGRIGDPISESRILVAIGNENFLSKTSRSVMGAQTHAFDDPLHKDENSFSSHPPPTWTKKVEDKSTSVCLSMHPINVDFGQHNIQKLGTAPRLSSEGRSWKLFSSDQHCDDGHFGVKGVLSDKANGFGQSTRAENSYAYGVDVVSSARSRSTSSQGICAIEDYHTFSSDSSFGDRDSTSHIPSVLATHGAYFLDSRNIPEASSMSGFSQSRPHSASNAAGSASPEHFGQNGTLESCLDDLHSHGSYSTSTSIDSSLHVNHVEKYVDHLHQRENEYFAALEQHIEDLTKEKFSLRRALETSNTLAESLAAENSSLTESYNQQGVFSAQQNLEMESLQTEITRLMAERESMRIQCSIVQLECKAADERANLLASEIIEMEEKALRLRSNELKLEKELEKRNAEVASYKKKMLRLEKERHDLQMTVDLMKEEKNLLQLKFRQASASGRSFGIYEQKSKKSVSTSTDDLEITHRGDGQQLFTPCSWERDAIASNSHDADSSELPHLNGLLGFGGSTMIVPSDQVQMIQNINELLSELITEKEELTQALVTQISTSSKLKDLNKDLSQRLEAQPQRLELFAVPSMEKEKVVARQPADSSIIHEKLMEHMTYADEGDEVVERVLGWVMKLIPGGTSRRQSI